MSPNEKINVKDCVKIYKSNQIDTVAIRKLKCIFYEGEISVIMGPSGSGKSTFLNILGGLEVCDSGSILFNGITDIVKMTKQELQKYRQKVGYLFQFFNLLPDLTAEENIKLPLLLRNISEKETNDRVQRILSQIGLSDRANHKPSQLSGGEQQKIALAVALANDPEILLCDEPTGELDSASKLKIIELISQMQKDNPKLTIIIVTHDPSFKLIADKFYIIKDGTIIHEMNKTELQKELGENKYNKDYDLPTNNIQKEKVVEELYELQNMIKEKIQKMQSK